MRIMKSYSKDLIDTVQCLAEISLDADNTLGELQDIPTDTARYHVLTSRLLLIKTKIERFLNAPKNSERR